ncbi:MAG TPA: hypothetical protein VEC35_24265 [Noviherbaspirillum sp.]|nr:hypothetical protein [Noviherbaspirillum sp.]
MKHHTSRKTDAKKSAARIQTPPSPFAGRPMDGSQYVDVIEEQEYADRRPTAEEQRPRFSYMKLQKN